MNYFRLIKKLALMTINAHLKDNALELYMKAYKELNKRSFSFGVKSFADDLSISRDVAEALIEYFDELGLIDLCKEKNDFWTVTLKIQFFDLHRMGGFTSIEASASAELQKLQLEIEALRSELDKNKFDKVMGSIQLLSAWLNTFI